MSFNTPKQRKYFYNDTFMLWPVDRRLSTFEQLTIEANLAFNKFRLNPSDVGMKKVCEHVSDLEVMIEVFELTFDEFRNNVDLIKKQKLQKLKMQKKHFNKADELEELAEKERLTAENFTKSKSKPKNFFKRLFN